MGHRSGNRMTEAGTAGSVTIPHCAARSISTPQRRVPDARLRKPRLQPTLSPDRSVDSRTGQRPALAPRRSDRREPARPETGSTRDSRSPIRREEIRGRAARPTPAPQSGIRRPAGDQGGDRLVREFLNRVTPNRRGGQAGLGQYAVEPVACARSLLAIDVAHALGRQVGQAANAVGVTGGQQQSLFAFEKRVQGEPGRLDRREGGPAAPGPRAPQ